MDYVEACQMKHTYVEILVTKGRGRQVFFQQHQKYLENEENCGISMEETKDIPYLCRILLTAA